MCVGGGGGGDGSHSVGGCGFSSGVSNCRAMGVRGLRTCDTTKSLNEVVWLWTFSGSILKPMIYFKCIYTFYLYLEKTQTPFIYTAYWVIKVFIIASNFEGWYSCVTESQYLNWSSHSAQQNHAIVCAPGPQNLETPAECTYGSHVPNLIPPSHLCSFYFFNLHFYMHAFFY